MTQKRRLRDVFRELGNLPWNHVVYLPLGTPTLNTECVVLDPDDAVPDQDIPREAADLNFEEGLGMDDIRSIRENAHLQGKRPSENEMLQALVYYLENDAFLDWTTDD